MCYLNSFLNFYLQNKRFVYLAETPAPEPVKFADNRYNEGQRTDLLTKADVEQSVEDLFKDFGAKTDALLAKAERQNKAAERAANYFRDQKKTAEKPMDKAFSMGDLGGVDIAQITPDYTAAMAKEEGVMDAKAQENTEKVVAAKVTPVAKRSLLDRILGKK